MSLSLGGRISLLALEFPAIKGVDFEKVSMGFPGHLVNVHPARPPDHRALPKG